MPPVEAGRIHSLLGVPSERVRFPLEVISSGRSRWLTFALALGLSVAILSATWLDVLSADVGWAVGLGVGGMALYYLWHVLEYQLLGTRWVRVEIERVCVETMRGVRVEVPPSAVGRSRLGDGWVIREGGRRVTIRDAGFTLADQSRLSEALMTARLGAEHEVNVRP